MSDGHILYEVAGHIAKVTLNRPRVLNALDEQAHAELAAVWDRVSTDDDVWVAVLRGAGDRAFCVGGDLAEASRRNAAGADVPRRPGGFGGLTDRRDMAKPVIAAVHGWCVGGGFELALVCDLIVASEDARFGLPEPRHGLVPTGGGQHRLVRQVPQKLAMAMILTGQTIDAAGAAAHGLVNEVVPAGEHTAAALRWAEKVVACAPQAVQALKESVDAGLDVPLHDAMNQSSDLLRRQRSSADRSEGLRAFAEHREPRWTGA